MAKNIVELLISAKDATKGAFDNTIKRISLLEKRAKALRGLGSVVGGLFAGYGAVQSFRAVISATREQEAALAQVEARLKSTGGASGETIESLQAMAAGLQKVSTYGDEAILKMQSLLLTFTNIKGDTFEKTTEAVLDMSVAMGQDLKTSALQLGKALNDPIKGITALTRVGVAFTNQQKEQIKVLAESGRMAEAQSIILNELAVEFGGAATAAADTFGGALEQLSNAFGDLLEADGNGITAAKTEIQELTRVLQDPRTKKAMDSLTGASITFAGVLAKIAVTADEAAIILGNTFAQMALNFQGADQSLKEMYGQLEENNEQTKKNVDTNKELSASMEVLAEVSGETRDILAEFGGLEIGNDEFSKKTEDIIAKLEEEKRMLSLTAKEQFIYNQTKKAGVDATYEEINAIKNAAAALYDEKEAIKSAKSETKQLTKTTKEYKKESESTSSSKTSIFGKEKEEAKELTKETEKATKEKKKWLSATSQPGKNTSDAFDPINLTPEQAARKATEIKAAMQQVFDTDPVQVKVNTPNPKQITNNPTSTSSFSDPLKGGGSGLSAVSVSRQALKQGNKQ